MIRVEITSAEEMDQPFDIRQLYTTWEPYQILTSIFTRLSPIPYFSVFVFMFTLCFCELLLMHTLIVVIEERDLVTLLRRHRRLRRRLLRFQRALSRESNPVEVASSPSVGVETEDAVRSTTASGQ